MDQILLYNLSIKSTVTFQVKSLTFKDYNGTPTIPPSRNKSMTTHSINRRPLSYHRPNKMIPPTHYNRPINCLYPNHRIHNSMMTRCNSRKNIYRTPHLLCNKRPSMRNNPIYHIRSTILLRLLLSILSQKPIPYTRTRMLLTSSRNQTPQPI